MPRYIIVTNEDGNRRVEKVINSDDSSDSDGDDFLVGATQFGASGLPNTSGSEACYGAFGVPG